MTSTDLVTRLDIAITDLRVIGASIPAPVPQSQIAAEAEARQARNRAALARFDLIAAQVRSPLPAFCADADELARSSAEMLGQEVPSLVSAGFAPATTEEAALPEMPRRGSVVR